MAQSPTDKIKARIKRLERQRRGAKLGSGKRFEALTKQIKLGSRRGKKRKKVRDPGAVAAAAGISKYGKARMAKMAAAGRKKG